MINNKEVVLELKKILEEKPRMTKHHFCLITLCEIALDAYEKELKHEGVDRDTFKALYDHAQGNVQSNAPTRTDWINEIKFSNYCKEIVEKNKARFIELDCVPVVETNHTNGGMGNKRLFWFDFIRISDQENDRDVADEVKPHKDSLCSIEEVLYSQSSDQIKLAFYMKPFFKDGEMRNRSLSGITFFSIWMLSTIGLIALLTILSYQITFLGNQNITFQLFNFGIAGISVLILIKYFYLPISKLPIDRVIKAPTLMLAFKEYDAEIEMNKGFKGQRTRFTRFTAECPICNGEITLQKGEKHHNLPLVGKCSESPFIHVYSFDRALMTGKLLSEHVILKNTQ